MDRGHAHGPSGRQFKGVRAEAFEAFELTPEEQVRLDTAPFLGADEAGWLAFAWEMQHQALKAYAEGEITIERALRVTMSCSLGCSPLVRASLVGLTARQALSTRPREWKRQRPANPVWVKRSAATLVQWLHEEQPDEPLAPNAMNNWKTPLLSRAIDWLVTLDLCDRVDERTLYKWHVDAKKDTHSNST